MRTTRWILTAVIFMLAIGVSAKAQENSSAHEGSSVANPPDSSSLTFYSRLQTIGILQNLKDPFRDDTRLYLYLKQARLGARAFYGDISYNIQIALGGEEEVKAPSPGISLSLLDLSANIPLTQSLGVKVGQFKVPYSRENMTDDGFMLFSDPSIQNLGFKQGRDVGIALHTNSGKFSSLIGVFTGGGRDVPIRYIPLDLGTPMIVARMGMNNGLDPDMFSMKQASSATNIGYAIFINALYIKDSKIGHSTALNVKLADKSLLLNSNWNPFIGKRPLEKNEVWQIGADVAARLRGKEMGLSGEAEVNYGSFKNAYGSLSLLGGRAQGAYFTRPLEFALRYAFLRPDEEFGVRDNSGNLFKIVDRKLIHEITMSISYYISGDRVKLTAEIPVYINAPVVTETNLGVYPLLQQPDQTTVIPTGSVGNQTVMEARLQLQVSF